MLKIVVLVSGGGTNLQAVIDGVKGGAVADRAVNVRSQGHDFSPPMSMLCFCFLPFITA